MALSVYKDRSFLIFERDGKTCKYDFSTKTTYGWSGKEVKSLQTQLCNISMEDLICACSDKNYGLFLQSIIKWEKSKHNISNIGTILSCVYSYSNLEQYYGAGITNVSKDMNVVPFADIPKGLKKICKENNICLCQDVYQSYKKYADIFNFAASEQFTSLSFKDIVNDILTTRSYRNNTNELYIESFLKYNYQPKFLFRYIDNLMTYEACNRRIIAEILDYAIMMSKISPKFDKYPRHFLTTHAIACRNYNRLNQQFQEEQFTTRIDTSLEDEIDRYVFMYPKSVQDIKDEAVQQNNCVASYIKNVISGDCHIMFMRYATTPNNSLVTLEIRNGCIIQAKQRFNDPVTIKQQEAIDKWNMRHKQSKYINIGKIIKM